MKKSLMLLVMLCALGLATNGASAGSAIWTWPTQDTNNAARPLSQIGGFQVYDTSVPAPGFPGTAVTGCVAQIPPTTPTGSCTAAFTVGHAYVLVINDNATPPNLSAPSNIAVATGVVVAPFKAVTDLKVIGP